MSRAKREPRTFTVDDIRTAFGLKGYWFGPKWCPAVQRKSDGGYRIRVVKSVTVTGANRHYSYDYFEIDADGTITSAPHGYAKDWKPGRVTDVAEAAELDATPDPEGMRIL